MKEAFKSHDLKAFCFHLAVQFSNFFNGYSIQIKPINLHGYWLVGKCASEIQKVYTARCHHCTNHPILLC